MQHLFRHLATYNQWMNRKLYNAAAVLSDEQLTQAGARSLARSGPP
ncbi:MAG: hypothetical protein ACK4F8_06285 [Aquabacterium sp.]